MDSQRRERREYWRQAKRQQRERERAGRTVVPTPFDLDALILHLRRSGIIGPAEKPARRQLATYAGLIIDGATMSSVDSDRPSES